MRKTSISELHLRTGSLVNEAARGEVIVIERRGVPLAELRPVRRKTPADMVREIEARFAGFPKMKDDSGRFISEDRDRE